MHNRENERLYIHYKINTNLSDVFQKRRKSGKWPDLRRKKFPSLIMCVSNILRPNFFQTKYFARNIYDPYFGDNCWFIKTPIPSQIGTNSFRTKLSGTDFGTNFSFYLFELLPSLGWFSFLTNFGTNLVRIFVSFSKLLGLILG